jgi:hypothetical protein
MFGPYEIECSGGKYYGNVSLKEFHKFYSNGEHFLFLVENMSAHKIPEATSRIWGMRCNGTDNRVKHQISEHIRL